MQSKAGKSRFTNIFEIEEALRSHDDKVRWAAAEAAGELLPSRPRAVWSLIVTHGVSEVEDLRAAVATCMLEHLLEERFDEYFPLLEAEIRAGKVLLGDTLRRCFKLGQAELPPNSERWNGLVAFAKHALGGRSESIPM